MLTKWQPLAKDLTKMSAKSAIKLVIGGADEAASQSALFRWVARPCWPSFWRPVSCCCGSISVVTSPTD